MNLIKIVKDFNRNGLNSKYKIVTSTGEFFNFYEEVISQANKIRNIVLEIMSIGIQWDNLN